MTAVYFSQLNIMLMLIDANADIFLCDNSGMSAAKLALRGHIALIMLTKIKTICGDDSQATAKKLLEIDCSLSTAALLKDSSIISYMLDHGREVDEPDRYYYHCTALQYAVRYADINTVNLLLDRRANINLADSRGQRPIIFYDTDSEDTSEKIEVLRTLIDRGASLAAEHPGYECPAEEHLLRMGRRDTIRTLLPYLDDMTGKTEKGIPPPLHILMINTKPGVIEECKDKDWDFHVLHDKKRSALWGAAKFGNIEAIEFLLRKGVDANGVNSLGLNVLMSLPEFTAAEQRKNVNRLKCAEILLRHGADPQHEHDNSEENKRDTIFEYIQDSQDFALAEIILAHLAYIEELGVTITKTISSKINSEIELQRYFQLCKRRFDNMKKIAICDELTLYEFFMESERKIMIRARNPDFVSGLKQIIHNQRDSTMYYSNMLRKRFNTVMRIVELKEIVLNFISKNCESGMEDYIIEKIVEYIMT